MVHGKKKKRSVSCGACSRAVFRRRLGCQQLELRSRHLVLDRIKNHPLRGGILQHAADILLSVEIGRLREGFDFPSEVIRQLDRRFHHHNATKIGKELRRQQLFCWFYTEKSRKSSDVARKSIGENNVKFQVVLPAFLDDEITELAALSDLSKAQYIRRVLRQAVQQRAIYSQEAALTIGDRRVVTMDEFPDEAVAEKDQAHYKSGASLPAHGAGQSGSTPPLPDPTKSA